MSIRRVERAFEETPDGKCAIARRGMVATAFPNATKAGVRMLEQGGNAVDAACAAAFALGVCEPQASGVGGQTMAILRHRGKTIAIDGSTRVPSLAHLKRLRKYRSRLRGYKGTTVPSTPAVLGHLHRRYGRLEWRDILEPAIRIAHDGYRITKLQHELQVRELDSFQQVKSGSGARYFLKNGAPYDPGDLFIQPDLGALLERLAENGPEAFYTGEVAERIDADMRANKGLLRADDLALIPWPIERRPIKSHYRGLVIRTLPPPAAGRTLLLVLLMLEHLPPEFLRKLTKESYHFLAETFRKAFLRRTGRPYDPHTYHQVPEKMMNRPSFVHKLARSIRDEIDPDLPLSDPPTEPGETTHLSVMDNEGNAIGITQSIELVYGSKAAAEGLGFLYNNYLLALDTKNPAHPYYLRPNAVPWTSVAPTIVFREQKPWLVMGSPGSERIFSTLGQFLVHMVEGGVDMGEAMRRPRLHCSIGGRLSLEAERFDPDVVPYLRRMGYKIDEREPYAFYLGAVHAVMKCQTRGGFQGVAEIRRDGTAEGPS